MKKRNRKTGQYKRVVVNANNKRAYLEEYYRVHKSKIDKAVAIYKKRRPSKVPAEKVFIDKLLYGSREWHSAKTANYEINKMLYVMRGGDEQLYEAKHTAVFRPEEFKDLRSLNKRLPGNFINTEVETQRDSYRAVVQGYYEITGSDYVIAKVMVYYDDNSPTQEWEYLNRYELGM